MYTKGEIVWAKIKGFPWWPGIIAEVIENSSNPSSIIEVLVNFIGENSHAQLTLDKVAKFQAKYDEFAKMKKKKLLQSIEIANKILKGETTYEAESDKLGDKSSPSPSTVTSKKPDPSVINSSRKRKDSRFDEKSPSNGLEGTGMQCESDHTAGDDGELLMPNDNKKRNKPIERKNSKKEFSPALPGKAVHTEKSTSSNKTTKGRAAAGKREAEDSIEAEEPKVMKAFKLNEDSEDLPRNPQENINETAPKLEKEVSKMPSILETLSMTLSFQNTSTAETMDTKNSPLNLSGLNLSNDNEILIMRPMQEEFEAIRELIIEMLVNNETSSASESVLEKRIEDIISKISPETVSFSEILENSLGKNIHTLILLLDELIGSSGMNCETKFGDIKEKLVSFNDVIKNRLLLHFVENSEYSKTWLDKVQQKKAEKAAKKPCEPVQCEQTTTKLERINQQLNEEAAENTDVKVEEEAEEEKPAPVLQINFEDYRYESEKKKGLSERNHQNTTTSTKIVKPIYSPTIEAAKIEAKQMLAVINPTLRRKICLKMSKILQDKYNLEKNAAQDMTIKIETKIRSINPDMQGEYKDKILIVLKLLKFSLNDIQEYVNDYTDMDFLVLREKLETYHKLHLESRGDSACREDSPCLSKEISHEPGLVGIKMSEFK